MSPSVPSGLLLGPLLGLALLMLGLVLMVSVAWPLVWNRDRTVSGLRTIGGLTWWMATAWLFYQFTLALPGRGVAALPGQDAAPPPPGAPTHPPSAASPPGVVAHDRPALPPGAAPTTPRASDGREVTPAAASARVGSSTPADVTPAGAPPAVGPGPDSRSASTGSPGTGSPGTGSRESGTSVARVSSSAIRVREVVDQPPPWSGAERDLDADPNFAVFRSAPSANRERAIEEVVGRATAWLRQRFEQELPGPLVISDAVLDRHAIDNLVIEEFVRPVELPGGGREQVTMHVAHLRLKVNPRLRLAVYADHRERVATRRIVPLAGGVLALSLLLGTVAGGLRLDHLTQGRRRMRLWAGVGCVLVATATGVVALARGFSG